MALLLVSSCYLPGAWTRRFRAYHGGDASLRIHRADEMHDSGFIFAVVGKGQHTSSIAWPLLSTRVSLPPLGSYA
ncbi:hypothetical protein CKAH01_14560 [Colletotrichum kahawae]|uniref:Uncharacterized protein n=1 Tax=Colletotrichum kahawae TaxID=34407 RepID=A0AAE0D9K8_COLKA|nr:hypothetical protein CKAH01_14560 [Colletotrichum kahawae]